MPCIHYTSSLSSFFLGPLNFEVYPNHTYPLVLFPQTSFQGTPLKVRADVYIEYASNAENKRSYKYNSARVLFTRSVIFSRNKENDQEFKVIKGSDISNLESYFASNADYGASIWFNYAKTINSVFYVKVSGNSLCDSCSEIGGCCYTGTCVCLPRYFGVFCNQTV